MPQGTLRVVEGRRDKRTPLERVIDDFIADMKAAHAAPKTLAYYDSVLNKVFLSYCRKTGATQIDMVADQKFLNRWTTHLVEAKATHGGKLSKFTIDSYARTVNRFLNWARSEGEVTSAARAHRPPLPKLERKVLQQSDFEAMEGAAQTERDKLIMRVLWQTGIRASELTGLTVKDLIDGSDRRQWLHIKGKGGHERNIQITPKLYRSLRRFTEKRGKEQRERDEIWLGIRRSRESGEFEPMTASGLGQMLRSTAYVAGIDKDKDVGPHAWRHSFATRMILKGMDLFRLQAILGHRSLAMLHSHYAHVTATEAGDALVKLLRDEE